MEIYGKLLEIGLDAYIPVMYIRHDCVVRTRSGQHIDIELKSRSSPEGENLQLGSDFKSRPDFFVILHYIGTDDSWVLPSKVAEDVCQKGKSKQIRLSKGMRQKLEKYKNAYRLIIGPDS